MMTLSISSTRQDPYMAKILQISSCWLKMSFYDLFHHDLLNGSGDCQRCQEMCGWYLLIFRSSCYPWKCSEMFKLLPSAIFRRPWMNLASFEIPWMIVFECLRTNFGYLMICAVVFHPFWASQNSIIFSSVLLLLLLCKYFLCFVC